MPEPTVSDLAHASESVYSKPDQTAHRLGLTQFVVLRDGYDVPQTPFESLNNLLHSVIGKKLPVAFVGSNDDCVIVSFRGSVPPKTLFSEPTLNTLLHVFRDWLRGNLDYQLESFKQWDGKVSRGFANLHSEMWDPILLQVKKQCAGHRRAVHVTGHSLGGALAILAADCLVADGLPVGAATVFGAPKVGNPAFAKACRAKVRRYECGADIVPFLPPDPSIIGSFLEGVQTALNFAESVANDIWKALTGDKLNEKPEAWDVEAYRAVGERFELSGAEIAADSGRSWKQTTLDMIRVLQGGIATLENANMFQFLSDHDVGQYHEHAERHEI